ncbi:MAG: nucleotidyl transferase AbiEii/AbiGii toxin family protein [bacterium]|nr:nucleotidyl transferase AbiEii/AbiGii toxin family protein [bacterium]
MGGNSIARLCKHWRKLIELQVSAGLHHCDQVEVLGGTLDDAEQQQRTSANADDLYSDSPVLHVIARQFEGLAETCLVEQRTHERSLHARYGNFNFSLLSLAHLTHKAPPSQVVNAIANDQYYLHSNDAYYQIQEPERIGYPSLLGLPSARLRAYRPETMIGEKLHAMVVLGSKNSRMRDFFDICTLAHRRPFDMPLSSQGKLR